MAIGVQLTPPFVEDSHLTIFPVLPERVIVPVDVPAQAVTRAGERVPPKEAGVMVMVPVALTAPQPPLNGIV